MVRDKNLKIGIVLEGGAMRGMYTAAILDAFLDEGIPADIMVGVSAGALFGVNYVSKQKGRVIRYNKRFTSDPDYLGIKPLLKEGNIIGTELAYERLPFELDPFDNETYMASDTKFYAVITNLETGKAEYVHVVDAAEQMDVLKASGSMPTVSRPVELDGKLYLDGAIGDSIPFEWMMDQGVDRIIVILTRDESYRKKPMNKAMTLPYRRKYPLFAKGMMRRHLLYNTQTDVLKHYEEQGKAFVIRPSEPITIGRIERDPDKLQQVYDLGLRDAADIMDALKAYIEA